MASILVLCCREAPTQESNDEVSPFEELVGTVRKEICSFVGEVNSLSNKASSVVKENWEASNGMLSSIFTHFCSHKLNHDL